MTSAKRRFLACALGQAAALAAVWLLLAVTASASPPGPVAPAVIVGPLTAMSGPPASPAATSIELRKTAGTDPSVCGSDDTILLTAGATVVYCYVTYNTSTSPITLTHHSATDSQLGLILDDKVFTLTPGSGVFFTVATTLNISVTNTAVWTAFNPGPTDVVTDTDSATVTIISAVRFLPALFR